jgi:uncharacterized membrane protein
MLPLYGSGALIMLVSTLWAKDNYILVYFCGLISATCLEYLTGVAMEAMFKMRYWDYSKKRFNLHGYICLSSSLFWGVLSVLLVCFVHTPIATIVRTFDITTLNWMLICIGIITTFDMVVSFKKAFDFKKLLVYETAVKKEIVEITGKISEAKNSFAEKNTQLQSEYMQKQEERVEHLRLELDNAKGKLRNFKNSVVRSFPSATSKRFGEALDEFKEYFNIGR